jgi:hypothetical protein
MIFSVSIPKIDVNSINPVVGPTGTSVGIDGYGFNTASAVKFHGIAATGAHFSGASAVKFGTARATFKIVSDTEITTTVPTVQRERR